MFSTDTLPQLAPLCGTLLIIGLGLEAAMLGVLWSLRRGVRHAPPRRPSGRGLAAGQGEVAASPSPPTRFVIPERFRAQAYHGGGELIIPVHQALDFLDELHAAGVAVQHANLWQSVGPHRQRVSSGVPGLQEVYWLDLDCTTIEDCRQLVRDLPTHAIDYVAFYTNCTLVFDPPWRRDGWPIYE